MNPPKVSNKALRVAFLFILLASLWIVSTNQLLASKIDDTQQLTQLQTLNGLGVTLAAAVILYFLIRRQEEDYHWVGEGRVWDAALVDRMMETSLSGIVLLDKEARITGANANAERIFGLKKGEILSRTYSTTEWAMTDYDGNPFPEEKLPVQLVLENSRPVSNVRHTIEREDGRRVFLSVNASPLFDEAGEPDGMIAMMRDVTAQEEAEESLRESKAFLQAAIECLPFDFFAVGGDGRYNMQNSTSFERWGNILGKLPEEVASNQETLAFWLEQNKRAFSGETVQSEVVYDIDGKPRNFVNIITPILEADQTIGILGVNVDITERIQAEKALQESGELYRSLAKTSPDAVTVSDLEGTITQVSDRTVELHGAKNAGEMVGRSALEFLAPEEHERAVANIQKTLEEGIVRGIQYRMLRMDGTQFIGELSAAVVVDSAGVPKSFIAAVRDITESVRSEAALRSSEARYSTLFQQSNDPIFIHDLQGNIQDVNQKALDLFGYSRDEMYGLKISDLHPESALGKSEAAFEAVSASGFVDFEIEFKKKDGEIFSAEVSANQIDIDGERVVQGIVRDITERVKALDEIQRLKDFNESILQNMSEGVVVDDEEGHFYFVNPAAATLLGYEAEEILGRHWTEFFPEDQQKIVRAANERRKRGIHDRYEVEFMRKDGTRFPVLISGSPRIENEALKGTMAVFMDITARKQRDREQQAIVTLATALRAAANRAEMLPIILDQMLELLVAEGAALMMREPGSGGTVAELAHGEWANWTGERLPSGVGVSGHVIETGKPYLTRDAVVDGRFARPDLLGGVRALICVPLVTQDETIGALFVGRKRPFAEEEVRILSAIADMSASALRRANLMETLEQRVYERTRELAQANEQLKELDRLKSEFVSNVSHELRTPITNIVLYLDLIDRLKRGVKYSRYMEVLRSESRRLSNLIEDLLMLSKLEHGQLILSREPHVLDALISEVLSAHEARIKSKSLVVNHEPNSEVPSVPVDREEIVQVFNNMLSNAIAYSTDNSMVTFTSWTKEIEGNPFVAFRIHNEGPAIPAEELPHIFERFYRGRTSRASGEPGTGLGLAICKEIVERHQGWIDVESSGRKGTAFTVWIPVHPEQSTPPA
jgi:PAS domain S-box-containing protein